MRAGGGGQNIDSNRYLTVSQVNHTASLKRAGKRGTSASGLDSPNFFDIYH